jgi:hypothetical protein
MVASATRADLDKIRAVYSSDQTGWQTKAYRHYRICGEARFAANFYGHAFGKSELYVCDDLNSAHHERLTSGPAYDALDDVMHNSEGQSALLTAIGIHFTIAGECYLIGTTDENGNDVWAVYSVLEVGHNNLPMDKGGKWWIKAQGNQPQHDLGTDDVVIRLWMPDPENSLKADSPFRSLMSILDEIEWLTMYVFAQCTQRLAGGGLLIMPEEIDFPPPPDGTSTSRSGVADKLMATLGDVMMKGISDPSSPAAKVPITLTAPGDQIKNAKWITFWSELDSEAKLLRQEAIQRFALGIDLPPERVLGMAANLGTGGGRSNGVSHWGAWQIDEDTIKMHIEPGLDVVVAAFTSKIIRPLSRDETAAVGYDTSALRLRPDRSKESLELWDRGLVSSEVVLRENGFDPDVDAMPPDERRLWILTKMATGSATPEMVAAAAGQLGVSVPALGTSPNESRPVPSLESHPTKPRTPEPEDSESYPGAAALLHASEGLVYRALERAGNRLRSQGVKPDGLRSFEVHTVVTLTPSQAAEALVDAWACAPQVLEGLADVEGSIKRLHSYTMGLLTTGRPHTREALATWLEKVPA